MSNELVFKSQKIEPIIINKQPYVRGQQIAVALNYKRADIINQIYNAHADEFTSDMTLLTEVETKGGKQVMRVFSLRGCHLLAMFSKTPIAKEFRKWILDLIDHHNQNLSLPVAQVDMKAIGGMVKKCCAVAVREELTKALSDDFETQNWLEIMSPGLKMRTDNLVKQRHADLISENEELKLRLNNIKLLAN